MGDGRRYTLISSDAHAGASIQGYKPYLATKYHDEFDVWAESFHDGWDAIDAELETDDPNLRVGTSSFLSPVNWESDVRLEHQNSEGIAAEIIFPNTVPPFYPSGAVTTPGPSADQYEHRWAGVQAHNRWLKDFCDLAPGRRGGLAQVFLSNLDDAIAEVRWAKEAGLAGVLIPSDHTTGLVPLYGHELDPFWEVCCELDFPVTRHAISSTPFDDPNAGPPFVSAISVHETNLFFQRGIAHLILGGVFDRYPGLKFAFTETATVFLSMQLLHLENELEQGNSPGTSGYAYFRQYAATATKTPTELFRQNVWLGASLMTKTDVKLREQFGVDRVMWGADYPHHEGTFPHTDISLRMCFSDIPEDEVRAMTSLNTAKVYGFDLDHLQTIADEIGPTPEELARPVTPDEYPDFTMSISIQDGMQPTGVI